MLLQYSSVQNVNRYDMRLCAVQKQNSMLQYTHLCLYHADSNFKLVQFHSVFTIVNHML